MFQIFGNKHLCHSTELGSSQANSSPWHSELTLHCWLLSWGGRCTTDPGHMPLSSTSWDSSCSCSEVAVNGKKMQSEHSGQYKLTSVYWLLTYVHDYENWGTSVQRFIFIQIALFLSCFHGLCPSLPQSNQVNGPECGGSGVWTESCSLVSQFALLNLRCAKWGRCRNLAASPDTPDTESWNPNKEDINQRMPKWLFPIWWRLVSWTGFCLLFSSICISVSAHTSQQKENISQ